MFHNFCTPFSKLVSYILGMQRKEMIKAIKEMIANGTYDWEAAIEHTASRIMDYPESLLWV
jgi:hypothetical protein